MDTSTDSELEVDQDMEDLLATANTNKVIVTNLPDARKIIRYYVDFVKWTPNGPKDDADEDYEEEDDDAEMDEYMGPQCCLCGVEAISDEQQVEYAGEFFQVILTVEAQHIPTYGFLRCAHCTKFFHRKRRILSMDNSTYYKYKKDRNFACPLCVPEFIPVQLGDELSDKVGADFMKCLHGYQKMNNELPERIIMYRDGVGDGQLKYVYETELGTIRRAITELYKSFAQPEPKFSFIVVTKKINTRMFSLEGNGRPVNPGPGTVADDVITYPERYDFYVIAQYTRQGSVSPVSYNVLYDTQGLSPDRIQKLTFKLTHMYFNWRGTVTVPAPCQYAYKLAYLTGLSLGAPSNERLANSLHFL
ncbi:Protein aubergine [Orchesella cincta]|uniref:Protein aubergine n=1 Tax=Orchesella cincta TaxID=48709 RepID=A0A1D2MEQ5_ORCCI|nr:Protein aubergine [Orchesella cincta]